MKCDICGGNHTTMEHIERRDLLVPYETGEITSIQSRLDAAEKERDEALAVLGPGWPETLLETCQSYKAADDAVPEDMHGADTLAQVIEWLTSERDELKQRCAKLEGAARGVCGYLIPVFNNTAVAFESPMPIENLRALETALAPDPGADPDRLDRALIIQQIQREKQAFSGAYFATEEEVAAREQAHSGADCGTKEEGETR